MTTATPLDPKTGIDPKTDLAAYRRCLGQFATGVTVITAEHAGTLVGLTANSFTSVSLDPALVLWSIKYESDSFEAFKHCTHYSVNILSAEQIAQSNHFSKSGGDKFAGMNWQPGLGGAPVLDGAIAVFECANEQELPGGDHLMFLGRVERFRHLSGDPLLFVQGRYGVAMDHPQSMGAVSAADKAGSGGGPLNEFFSALMYRAYGELTKTLEQGRRGAGLSATQSRLLAAVETFPDRTLDSIIPEMYLGNNAVEHTVSELKSMGLLQVSAANQPQLTDKGRERLNAMLESTRRLENQQLQDMPAEDIEACRRVLKTLIERGSR